MMDLQHKAHVMKVLVICPVTFDLSEIKDLSFDRIRSGDESYIEGVRDEVKSRADYHLITTPPDWVIETCGELPQIEDDYQESSASLADGDGKKVYVLLVRWEMAAQVQVRADNVEEACDILEKSVTNLPKNGCYCDGSFEVDRELAENDYPEDDESDEPTEPTE